MTETLLIGLLVLTLAALAYHIVHQTIIASAAYRSPRANHYPPPFQWPSITVMVPARNEEANILRCLHSLAALDYPLDRLQVLIGNDRSEDQTAAIAAAFIANRSNFRLVDITHNLPGQQGKQNVLAQLAHHATGELLVVTDADIAVAPTWLRQLASVFHHTGADLVSGPTVVEGKDFLGRMQQLDWLYGIGTFQGYANLGYPVTAVGNNMAIRASAYRQLGGYEALPFSITEDYRLYEAVTKAGGKSAFPFHAELLNRSNPIQGLKAYIHQRARWHKGGSEAPWYVLLSLYVQAALVPLSLLCLWLSAGLALGVFALKWLYDTVLIQNTARRLLGRQQANQLWGWLLAYPFYFYLSILFFLFYLPLQRKVDWKGRKI